MDGDLWTTLRDIGPASLLGGSLIVVAAWFGWRAAAVSRGIMLSLTRFWLDRVARPLLRTQSWSARTAIIAVNNSAVCAAMVAAGGLGKIAWLAVIAVGLALGAGLRMLTDLSDAPLNTRMATRRQRMAVAIGIALNMLEPPAIMLCAGLSLVQGAWKDLIAFPSAMALFAAIALPTLVVAAGGEALWLTAGRFGRSPDPADTPNEDALKP